MPDPPFPMKIYVRGQRWLLGLLGTSCIFGPIYAVAWLTGWVHIINKALTVLGVTVVSGAFVVLGVGLLSIALGFGRASE